MAKGSFAELLSHANTFLGSLRTKTRLNMAALSTAHHNNKKLWSLGLLVSMNNPEEKLEEDELVVVIKDKYPKARHHFLVLPKKKIDSIKKVTREDLELLCHMETVARKFVNCYREYEFQIGYHAIPSMMQLHLHVISTDFDSPSLKTKHHWNAFTTPFFIPSADVCKQLEEYGAIKINYNENQEYLKRKLKCHKCTYAPNTIVQLKNHLLQHISQK